MGLADLIKMGYFACDGATAAEKAWICKNWREFKNRLYRQLQLSENLGCTTGPASHNAYLGQINEKPPCCN